MENDGFRLPTTVPFRFPQRLASSEGRSAARAFQRGMRRPILHRFQPPTSKQPTMRLLAALLLTALVISPRANAQPTTADDAGAVMAPIHDLFDAMRAADSSAVRAAFHPTATLRTVGTNRDGVMGVFETPLDRFVAAMTGEHPVYDERLGEAEVRIDGDLAAVWVPYAFYLGDTFS